MTTRPTGKNRRLRRLKASSRLHELQTELIRLETKRVKAAAGGASNATLSTALALTPQEEDRAAFLERLLAKRESEGVPQSARPSADARRELIALLARRAAAEQAEDERANVLEAMLEAEDAKDANAKDANAKDANAAAAASAARDELRALRERRAARRFDLVVTSPAVPPRGTNGVKPHTRHRHRGRNRRGIEESESERKGAAFLATPKPPARRARDALPSDASGRRPSADPKRPGSTQRSQFGPMVDSLKRSSPRVGFGSALRFDFQRASAPPPDSERGRTLRRSQSRLRAARGGAPAGLAAADDAFGASFSVPGPGTYATTKYRAFGPQSDGEKKSFPAVSMGRAGRFAAAERETKTTRSWPGPDAYDAASSLGAQRVSRCDTLPRIAFTRARRAVGNVDVDGVSESEISDAIPKEGGGVSGRRPPARFPLSGRRAVAFRARRRRRRRRDIRRLFAAFYVRFRGGPGALVPPERALRALRVRLPRARRPGVAEQEAGEEGDVRETGAGARVSRRTGGGGQAGALRENERAGGRIHQARAVGRRAQRGRRGRAGAGVVQGVARKKGLKGRRRRRKRARDGDRVY